jgi:hypothetical protein
VRLRTLSVFPIAIISMLAAGTRVAAAATDRGHQWCAVAAAVAFTAQGPVNHGSAGGFAILVKSGVTEVFNFYH